MRVVAELTNGKDISTRWHGKRILCLYLAITIGGVAAVSPYALMTTLLDLPWAVAALLPGVALGMLTLPVRRWREVSQSWHFLLAAAWGIGSWCIVILGLGLLGWLDQRLFLGISGAAAIYLVLRWRNIVHGEAALGHAPGNVAAPPRSMDQSAAHQGRRYPADATGSFAWLWLLTAPFLVLAILSASNAPGFLWKEEGFGYDVLEYHLQLPREYAEEGRITYRPHNVYANFPANVEMLYLAAMVLTGAPQDAGTTGHLIHLILGAMMVATMWRVGAEWSPRAGVAAGVTTGTAGWIPYLSGLAYVELGMLFFGAAGMGCLFRCAEESRKVEKSKSRNTLGMAVLAGVLAGFACGCKYTALPMIAGPMGVALFVLYRGTLMRRLKATAVFGLAALIAFSPWLVKNTVMTGNPVFPLAQRVFQASPPGWGAAETNRWNRGHLPRTDKSGIGGRLMALWRNLPGDHHQRFGPAMFLLAVSVLILPTIRLRWRRHTRPSAISDLKSEVLDENDAQCRGGNASRRVDIALMLMLALQLLVWTFATHLFARFAVVMLIPLGLLCGRAALAASTRVRAVVVLVLLIAGATWNFIFAVKLHAAESPGGAPAAWLYEGKVPGYEYLGYINQELPADAKILMVGDARPFYVLRPVDYTVVFNRHPFVQAVERAKNGTEIVHWLQERGYTHVLVHWGEIARLKRTYGFSDRINETLFEELEKAGLQRRREFNLEGFAGRYVSLYEVVELSPMDGFPE